MRPVFPDVYQDAPSLLAQILTTGGLIILGIILVAWLFTTVVIVKQQTVQMIETFGKFTTVRHAGLSFKAPWPIQSASVPLSLRVLEISQDVTVKSIDNAFLKVPIRVQYKVRDDHAEDAFYKLEDPEEQIRSYIVNQVRSTASGLTFDALFQARDTFESDVSDTLEERMRSFGYEIINVLVDDPQPSDDLRKAFDRVIAAKRLKEAAENEGEAARVLAVAKAEAEGQSLEIKGRAYAAFRKIVAKGNGEALEEFCAKTGLTGHDALAFFTSINEMEAVRDASNHGGRVVFVAGSAARTTPDAALLGMIQTPSIDTPNMSKGTDATHTPMAAPSA